jgi:hypothetical protein
VLGGGRNGSSKCEAGMLKETRLNTGYWVHTCNLALRRGRKIWRTRPAWATEQDPVSKKNYNLPLRWPCVL